LQQRRSARSRFSRISVIGLSMHDKADAGDHMLNAFEQSADFYDDLYEGKDYAAEADYVDTVIQQHSPGARSLLDLGCGTGRHAIELAGKGYAVAGVDRSPEMIIRARGHRERLSPLIRERVTFEHGDIRDFRLGRQFDAVVALFHVISYQVSNDDLLAAFTTAKAHLQANGVFIFDCWYGPGVLTDPPVSRTKTLSSGSNRLTRFAEPMMLVNEDAVEVNYRFKLADQSSRRDSEFYEKHVMRYFFVPELFLALQTVQLEPLAVTEWMRKHEPGRGTWSITVIARS
jgi:SAM-dependent methyltransferase